MLMQRAAIALAAWLWIAPACCVAQEALIVTDAARC